MDLSLIAVFAALLAASIAVPGINVGPFGVAITLQTLVVAMCGLVVMSRDVVESVEGYAANRRVVSVVVVEGLRPLAWCICDYR